MAADGARHAKLVLLGEASVGKTSLVLRFAKSKFTPFHEPTIGAAFLTQEVESSKGKVKFDIWDTAGQERYHSLAPMYYRDALAAVVAYDITQPESLARAKSWVKELQRDGRADAVIALTGTKADLEEDRRVPAEVGQEFADENGLIFMETSAKSDLNVLALFVAIANQLPEVLPPTRPTANITLEEEKKGCKCTG